MAPPSVTHSMIPVAGLDIGFFSTKFTIGSASGPSGSQILVDHFPSLAAKSAHKTLPHLPNAAALDGTIVTVGEVDYFVGKSVLSMMGAAGGARAASDNFCQTQTYYALMLGAFHYMAAHQGGTGNLVIGTLTLGLPLNTVFTHGEFVKTLAEREHTIPSPGSPDKQIKVLVRNVIVVAQPQGAMVNYTSGLKRAVKADEQALVLDMGGGTFDWFICDGEFQPNYSLCGAAPIGALACASVICERIQAGLKKDPRTLEKVDRALRNDEPTVRITGVDHEMASYWPLAESLIEEVLEQMQKQVGSLAGMDHILLTGGGAGLLHRVVRKTLSDFERITVIDSDPVFSNVKVFYRISKMMSES